MVEHGWNTTTGMYYDCRLGSISTKPSRQGSNALSSDAVLVYFLDITWTSIIVHGHQAVLFSLPPTKPNQLFEVLVPIAVVAGCDDTPIMMSSLAHPVSFLLSLLRVTADARLFKPPVTLLISLRHLATIVVQASNCVNHSNLTSNFKSLMSTSEW